MGRCLDPSPHPGADLPPIHVLPVSLGRSARRFFLDFAAFAGGEGIKGAVLVALGAVLEGAGLVLLVPMLGIVMNGQNQGDWIAARVGPVFAQFGVADRIGKLALLLAFFAGLVVLRAGVLWYRDITLARLRVGFVQEQRTRLVGRLAAAPWSQLSKLQHARINHLLSSDIVLTGSCVYFMLQGAVSLCMLVMQCALAFLFSPALALLAALLMAAAGFALIPQLAKSRALGAYVAEANLDLATSGAHFLGGLKLAVSQNLQHRFAKEFNETLGRLMQRQISFAREQSKAQLGFTTLASLVAAVAILVGLGFLDIAPSLLVVFVLVLARMSSPAAQLQQGAQQFANFLPSYDNIGNLEAELLTDEAGRPSEPQQPVPVGAIRFRGVSFCHSRGAEGVFDLDLTIEPESFVGITGASGAGKTTFADLLVGLIAPQAGDISIGGGVMTDALRRQWRSEIAYVPQEPFLFHDTIRSNFLWANPDVGESEIRAALCMAGADDLVSRLPEGLETIVGEKGMLFSGGERQRLALARALLRKPRLVVLDEATSAIDIPGERVVLGKLVALAWRPTIVLIAHRVESLALCTRVLEMSEGRFVSDSIR
jgi:ATP-binding cassette subfamily C protein